ncbi:hypothetical protein ACHWQZ_G013307 [Mnemiopsis leidyi]
MFKSPLLRGLNFTKRLVSAQASQQIQSCSEVEMCLQAVIMLAFFYLTSECIRLPKLLVYTNKPSVASQLRFINGRRVPGHPFLLRFAVPVTFNVLPSSSNYKRAGSQLSTPLPCLPDILGEVRKPVKRHFEHKSSPSLDFDC